MALGALQINIIKHQNGQRTITATAHAKKPDQEGHQQTIVAWSLTK
jgi:hypothetical protein